MLNGKDVKRIKVRGVALVGTVAAVIAWILLSYGIFTVQSSQFQMLISSNNSLNAQKLAEIDAALLKMVNYEDVTNNSALGEYNLHLDRGNLKSISVDGGWQDEIIISSEKLNKNDPDYGRFRIATINIYQDGDTEPRFSMQVPLTKSEQSYSRKTIDEFIEALRAKDRELEAKDRELEAKDRQLEAKDNEIASKIESIRSRLLAEIESGKCTCTGSSGDSGGGGSGSSSEIGGGGTLPPIGGGGSIPTGEQTIGIIAASLYNERDFTRPGAVREITFTAPVDGTIYIKDDWKEDTLYWGNIQIGGYFEYRKYDDHYGDVYCTIDGVCPEELKPITREEEYDDGEGGSYYSEVTIFPRVSQLSIKAGQTFHFYFAPTQNTQDTDDSAVYDEGYDFDVIFKPN